MADVDPERIGKLGLALADRLATVERDHNDLFHRFIDAESWVPISVLLMDKGLRRSALRKAGEGGRVLARAFEQLRAAAETHEDLALQQRPRTVVRLVKQKELPPAVAAAQRLFEAEEAQKAQDAAAAPAESGPIAPVANGNGISGELQRNCKGELGQFFAKKMGRSAAKSDMVFTTERVSERPPTFRAQCEVFGRTFDSKDAHSNKKAAEHDAALVALEGLMAESGETDATDSTDFKGQLLRIFDSRGQRGEVRFELERVDQEESEEKIFRGKLHLPGDLSFIGDPQSRSTHGCSAKTRRAAEQDVARRALLALQGKDASEANATKSTSFQPPVRPATREVQILWLPVVSTEMVRLQKVAVEDNDFLATAEAALGCKNTICYPLNWLGNRPKGLCLYEALDASEVVNERATAVAGSEVFGNCFMMDASAHSAGAELVDITLQRYEFLKADRAGYMREPVPFLNHSRGMSLCGHPSLPMKFSADSWVGLNPRTLLNDVARRKGLAQPRVEVYPCKDPPAEATKGQHWMRAAVSIPELGLQAEGAPATNKSDTQQDAALKALHRLQQEAEAAESVWEHPLIKAALLPAIRGAPPRTSRKPLQLGTKVVCSYQITLVVTDSDGRTHELPLEGHTRLTAAVGENVMHPAFEDLLQRLTPAGEALTLQSPCQYESNPCNFVFTVQLLELTVPLEPPPELPPKIKFDPPLWKQRQRFIVQALLARNVSSALDLGCGDGQLLEALLSAGLQRVLGVDLSEGRIKNASRRLAEKGSDSQHVDVLQSDFVHLPAEGEPKWISFAKGVQAIVLCEVLEHLPEASMPRLPGALFAALQPEVVVVTSPNADFGDSSDSEDEEEAGPPQPRQFRHADHEREWTRQEFREWAQAVSEKYGYWISELSGVGYIPELEAQGPCTQLAVFERKESEEPAAEAESTPSFAGMDAQVDLAEVRERALRSEELASEGSGLWKHVLREGEGDPPPQQSRVNVHYATYLQDGRRVDTSREGKRCMPCAFQLGREDQGLPAWQLAAATMRCGEVAWIQCPARYAYGSQGASPHVPANTDVWFCLELTSARAPGTVRFLSRVADALDEADRHMEVGRADVKRQAFAQARQAFRRAVAAVPEKLLLKQSEVILIRFAKMERASLLNQAHCCLKLGESVQEQKAESQEHFREALKACRSLIDRHGPRPNLAAAPGPPETMAQVAEALCRASQQEEVPWMAKAYFRMGMSKEKLKYLTDAMADYEAALELEPNDGLITKQLQVLKARLRKAELKPTQMFAGILQRERAEREREEAAADLAARRQRRDERLQREAAEKQAAEEASEATEANWAATEA